MSLQSAAKHRHQDDTDALARIRTVQEVWADLPADINQ
jgi:hypothetical protein